MRRPLGIVLIVLFVAWFAMAGVALVFGAMFGTGWSRVATAIGGIIVSVYGFVAARRVWRMSANAADTLLRWGFATPLIALALPLTAAPAPTIGAIVVSGAIAVILFFTFIWPLARYVRGSVARRPNDQL